MAKAKQRDKISTHKHKETPVDARVTATEVGDDIIEQAVEPIRMCSQPHVTLPVLPQSVGPDRAYAIYQNHKKWVTVTVLHYYFLDDPGGDWKWEESQRQAVRDAFGTWKKVGIGLSFVETNDVTEAEIKIGCCWSDGSWSFVGTDCIRYNDRGRTMNFGWDLRTPWGSATALHEIGHALGLEHEHQNPNAGIIWNEPEVLKAFSGPPNNWSEDTIRTNILNKIHSADLRGSKWQPDSLMEYPFARGLIIAPKPYDETGVEENYRISEGDKVIIRTAYPPAKMREIEVMQMEKLPNIIGAQATFEFKPKATRKYTIQTLGASDTRVVVFEERDNEPRHHDAADDSGVEENLKIVTKLVQGRNYIISTRTNFVSSPDGAGLLIT